jgi:hypothetical protein
VHNYTRGYGSIRQGLHRSCVSVLTVLFLGKDGSGDVRGTAMRRRIFVAEIDQVLNGAFAYNRHSDVCGSATNAPRA